MDNQPNRSPIEPTAEPQFLLEMTARLMANLVVLTTAQPGSPAFEKARKQALRSNLMSRKSLVMMGPPAPEIPAED